MPSGPIVSGALSLSLAMQWVDVEIWVLGSVTLMFESKIDFVHLCRASWLNPQTKNHQT